MEFLATKGLEYLLADELLADPAIGKDPAEAKLRIRETLELLETLTAWSDEMLRLDTETLTKQAQQRLDAIQSMEELGSGFYLAMHDLEIRGAGEVLGENQSGNMMEVGFQLYNDMLAEAVRALDFQPNAIAQGLSRQRSDTMQTQAVMSSSSITIESSVKRRTIQFRTELTPVTPSGIVTFSSGTCA